MSLMASSHNIIFSAHVSMQMDVATGFSFTFKIFPEMMVPQNTIANASATESSTSTKVRSNLTFPSSITRQVSELDITDVTSSYP